MAKKTRQLKGKPTLRGAPTFAEFEKLGLVVERQKCCRPAMELPPVRPKTKELCTGQAWGIAYPGECQDRPNTEDLCGTGNLRTFVDVYKWEFVWDKESNSCKVRLVANIPPKQIEVETCGGTSCV